MKEIPISEFRKLKVHELKDVVPIKILAEGEVIGALVDPEKVIVIEDLHPRVQIQLKALEKKARLGMPKDEKVYLKDGEIVSMPA